MQTTTTTTEVEKTIRFIETYIKLAEFQKDAIRKLCAEGIRSGTYTARSNGKSTFAAALALAQIPLTTTKDKR